MLGFDGPGLLRWVVLKFKFPTKQQRCVSILTLLDKRHRHYSCEFLKDRRKTKASLYFDTFHNETSREKNLHELQAGRVYYTSNHTHLFFKSLESSKYNIKFKPT